MARILGSLGKIEKKTKQKEKENHGQKAREISEGLEEKKKKGFRRGWQRETERGGREFEGRGGKKEKTSKRVGREGCEEEQERAWG